MRSPKGTRSRVRRVVTIVLLVVGGLVALVVLAGLYFLLRVERWEGDVPAVVRSADHIRMRVDLGAPLPPDALRPGPVSSTRSVYEVLPDATAGEQVTCRVRQTFQVNTNLGTGPQTEVVRCWR